MISSFCLLATVASLASVNAATVAKTSQPLWQIGPFVRPAGANPVIKPNPASVFDCPMRQSPIHWEATHTFNPAAVVRNGQICVLYRSEDDSGNGIGSFTSRLGLAQSIDGIHFKRLPAPVFYPDNDSQKQAEWDGGCEDPRLVESPDGTYVLTYTQWNRKVARLAVATSNDLLHWNKHGSAFANALGGKYANDWSKSGGIVCKLDGGRLIAATINGKYWMYYGEGDVHLAWSNNLIDWTPLEDSNGKLLIVLGRRHGCFDSDLAEGGPSGVLTDQGIVVFYNGKNAGGDNGDTTIPPGAYCGGQALFDANDPTKLIDRPEKPYYQPEMAFERTGQYAAGTTFTEGLVFFKSKWFLYYGCADSLVGVAVFDKSGKTIPEIIPAPDAPAKNPAKTAAFGPFSGSFAPQDAPVSKALGAEAPIGGGVPWTMNMWVKVNSQPDDLTMIAGFGSASNTSDDVGNQRYIGKFEDGIHFWGAHVDLGTGASLDVGKWQMLSAVYNGNVLALYKNGQEIGSRHVVLSDASATAQLAPSPITPDAKRFAGSISGFTVVNQALKPDQLKALLSSAPQD